MYTAWGWWTSSTRTFNVLQSFGVFTPRSNKRYREQSRKRHSYQSRRRAGSLRIWRIQRWLDCQKAPWQLDRTTLSRLPERSRSRENLQKLFPNNSIQQFWVQRCDDAGTAGDDRRTGQVTSSSSTCHPVYFVDAENGIKKMSSAHIPQWGKNIYHFSLYGEINLDVIQ